MRLLIYTLNATGALEEYKEAGRSVMKSLKARLLTAVVGISIILVLLFLGEIQPLVIAFAVAAVTAFMTGEYLHANKLLKKYFGSVHTICSSNSHSIKYGLGISDYCRFYDSGVCYADIQSQANQLS